MPQSQSKSTDLIPIPRWAIEFVLENAILADDGPPDEGWESEEMAKALTTIRAALQE